MNILFGCQGSALNIFTELAINLNNNNCLKHSCFVISEFSYYNSYNKKPLNYLKSTSEIFEWEIFKKKYSISKKRKFFLKNKYSKFNLWDSIICDRRLYLGKNAKYIQNYKCKYSHEFLNDLIYKTLDILDMEVSCNKYNLILTFVPATYIDYLLYFVAQANNISYI